MECFQDIQSLDRITPRVSTKFLRLQELKTHLGSDCLLMLLNLLQILCLFYIYALMARNVDFWDNLHIFWW